MKAVTLYALYDRATIEGKAYVVWGLYVLGAPRYQEVRAQFMAFTNLQVQCVEGCLVSLQTPSNIVYRIESASPSDTLSRISIDAQFLKQSWQSEKTKAEKPK